MADGRKNNGGKRKNSGAKGYGKTLTVLENLDKYNSLWWEELGKMMTAKPDLKTIEKEVKENNISPLVTAAFVNSLVKQVLVEKMFAMSEYNKLQAKRIPQDINLGNKDDKGFKIIVEEYVKK